MIISGPPTYFAGLKVEEEQVRQGLNNLSLLAEITDVLVADHHFARDLEYPSYLDRLRRINTRVLSAAEFMGLPVELLEAQRKLLWEKDPPDNNSVS